MKLIKWGCLFSLLLLSAAGCRPGLYPVELKIDGLTSEMRKAKISAVETLNETVSFHCGDRLIKVAPVGKRFSLSGEGEIFLSGEIVYAPDGPTRFLRIEDRREMILLVAENVRRGWRLLNEFPIRPGKAAGVHPDTGRFWTELEIVSDSGEAIRIKPGEYRTVETSTDQWNVFLVGASVSDIKDKKIADESPEFVADLIAVKL